MTFKLCLILLIGSTASALTVKNSLTQNWYYTLYKADMSGECERVSVELMKCPTNALNTPATYDKETARDLAEWDLQKGCTEVSDNVNLCDVNKIQTREETWASP